MQPSTQQQAPWWQQNPLQHAANMVHGLQSNLQRFAASPPWAQQHHPQPAAAAAAVASATTAPRGRGREAPPKPVTREELGRATWVFLHTLAAQFPDHPSRQQQRDARNLIDALTRIYPCGDCARHFKEIVKADPPTVSSGRDFQAWMCRTHNTVNRSIGKPAFNCNLAAARWAPLDCDDEGRGTTCDLAVGAAPPKRR